MGRRTMAYRSKVKVKKNQKSKPSVLDYQSVAQHPIHQRLTSFIPVSTSAKSQELNLIMWECSSYGNITISSYKWGSPSLMHADMSKVNKPYTCSTVSSHSQEVGKYTVYPKNWNFTLNIVACNAQTLSEKM